MGKGRPGSGVEPRTNSIRVNFTYGGEWCRETLEGPGGAPLSPTPSNLKYASRLVQSIRQRILAGTFDYAEFFPNSPKATKHAGGDTFGHYADLYVDAKCSKTARELADATKSQYKNELVRWKKRLGADRAMASIRHSWLVSEIGKVAFPSARMRNNSLIPLRAVFELWVADDRMHRANPMEGIDNATVQKGLPDPLSVDEVEAILAHLKKRHHALIALYFELAFFSGMRPEELIALRWSKVDWNANRVRVDVVRTFKGREKATKTYTARDAELPKRGMDTLRRLRKWTQLKDHGHVLENPVTERPWHDERSQRDHYWKPALKALKIRPRRASQTRSTYATMCLMAGMNPAKVATDLGHDVKMFFEAYATWINKADRGHEMAKFEAMLARSGQTTKEGAA